MSRTSHSCPVCSSHLLADDLSAEALGLQQALDLRGLIYLYPQSDQPEPSGVRARRCLWVVEGMGARRLGEQALGPWGDKGHLAVHSPPWGQACWNNWLDSSRDGGQSWGCCRGSRPPAPQAPSITTLPTAAASRPPSLSRLGDRPEAWAPPEPLPWWVGNADEASPGRCSPPQLLIPPPVPAPLGGQTEPGDPTWSSSQQLSTLAGTPSPSKRGKVSEIRGSIPNPAPNLGRAGLVGQARRVRVGRAVAEG